MGFVKLSTIRQYAKTLGLVLWLVAALYVAFGAWRGAKVIEQSNQIATNLKSDMGTWSYHGVRFGRRSELVMYIGKQEVTRDYPWLSTLFPDGILLVASFSMAILGGIGYLLRQISVEGKGIDEVSVLWGPPFSGLVGAMLYMLGTVLPEAVYQQNAVLRTDSLMSISFFAGLFSRDAFKYIELRVKKQLSELPQDDSAAAAGPKT